MVTVSFTILTFDHHSSLGAERTPNSDLAGGGVLATFVVVHDGHTARRRRSSLIQPLELYIFPLLSFPHNHHRWVQFCSGLYCAEYISEPWMVSLSVVFICVLYSHVNDIICYLSGSPGQWHQSINHCCCWLTVVYQIGSVANGPGISHHFGSLDHGSWRRCLSRIQIFVDWDCL